MPRECLIVYSCDALCLAQKVVFFFCQLSRLNGEKNKLKSLMYCPCKEIEISLLCYCVLTGSWLQALIGCWFSNMLVLPKLVVRPASVGQKPVHTGQESDSFYCAGWYSAHVYGGLGFSLSPSYLQKETREKIVLSLLFLIILWSTPCPNTSPVSSSSSNTFQKDIPLDWVIGARVCGLVLVVVGSFPCGGSATTILHSRPYYTHYSKYFDDLNPIPPQFSCWT